MFSNESNWIEFLSRKATVIVKVGGSWVYEYCFDESPHRQPPSDEEAAGRRPPDADSFNHPHTPSQLWMRLISFATRDHYSQKFGLGLKVHGQEL